MLFIQSVLLSLLAVSRSVLLFVLTSSFFQLSFFFSIVFCGTPPFLPHRVSLQTSGKSDYTTRDNYSAMFPASLFLLRSLSARVEPMWRNRAWISLNCSLRAILCVHSFFFLGNNCKTTQIKLVCRGGAKNPGIIYYIIYSSMCRVTFMSAHVVVLEWAHLSSRF